MAMKSEAAVRAAIVAAWSQVAGIGKVHPRFRYPLKGRDEHFKEIYVDDTDRINVWMWRRVQRIPVVSVMGDLVSVTHVYECMGINGVIDEEDSEGRFQALIEAGAAALDLDKNLGLGPGVTHHGLAIPGEITEAYLGAFLCHQAECQLRVDVEDC